MILQPGETLAGYRIDRIVGVGGMGIVYRAMQLSLDRTIALKVLSGELAGDDQFRERFRREARLAAGLDHPNIVPVFEAGDADGVLYIAMRFVDGTTLSQRLTRSMSPREAIEILRPIASALDAAHDAGLVHRDVKPANILISAAGHPYLADFGIAKGSALTGLTRTRGFMGSIHYAAPEQIDGLEASRATDVYALAGLLFHCLTGRTPYARDTEPGLLKAHLEDPAPSFRELGFDVPVALDDAIARGLAKRPEDRFPTAGALVDAIARALDALPEGALDERLPSTAQPAVPIADGPSRDAPAASGGDPSRILVPAAAGLTVADPLRPSDPAPAGAASRSVWDRPRARLAAALTLAAGALIAALIGFVTIGQGSDEQSLTAGPLTLAYSTPWQPAGAEVEGLRLEDRAALRKTGSAPGTLVAGRFATGADAALPPVALRKRWRDVPRPRLVRLGSTEAYSFRAALRPRGGQLVYLIPTRDDGYAAIVCETARRATADFLDSCAEVAATVQLPAGVAVPVGPDPELAARVEAALDRLAASRRQRLDELNRGPATKRAKAAAALAKAHRATARALTEGDVKPQDRARVRRVAVAATAAAAAFDDLASAGRSGDRSAYERARAKLARADRRLRAAIAGLRDGGYRLD